MKEQAVLKHYQQHDDNEVYGKTKKQQINKPPKSPSRVEFVSLFIITPQIRKHKPIIPRISAA